MARKTTKKKSASKSKSSPTHKKNKSATREIEKSYSDKQTAHKLRRLAEALEQGKRFVITVKGRRISVPPTAKLTIEHDATGSEEELEIEVSWSKP